MKRTAEVRRILDGRDVLQPGQAAWIHVNTPEDVIVTVS
jgi:hypothetical protein